MITSTDPRWVNANTYAYAYDSWSNRSSLTATGAENYTVAYQYDLNNRLTSSSKDDGAAIEATDYFYDFNGNQCGKLTSTFAAGSGSGGYYLTEAIENAEFYRYNRWGQLTSATIGSDTVTYSYYPSGLRAAKNGTSYILDGGNVVLEIESGAATAKYTRAMGLVYSEIGGASSYYLYNAHGDVVQLTDASGAVVRNYEYDAFGVERDPDDADVNPFRYCGEYFDAETGTYYLRARYYDPVIGRFLAEDTHWNPGNMIYGDDPLQLNRYTLVPNIQAIMQSGNLYVYCMSDPIVFFDLFGLKAGDIFDSMDEAACDLANEYYATSEYIFLELSSWIYAVWEGNRLIGYAYTEVIVGEPHSVDRFWDGKDHIPQGGSASGWIHTHPNSRATFSSNDVSIARDNNLTAYVVAPRTIGGTIIDINKYGDTRRGFREQEVARNISYRALTVEE